MRRQENSRANNNDESGRRNNDIDLIIEMYRDYVARQTNTHVRNSAESDLQRIQDSKEVDLLRLRIELPISEIQSIYKKTGVIQLRGVTTSDKLLLGCGNGPCDKHYDDDKKHDHEGFVTINPELSMNPCVIGAFGVNAGLNKVLPKDFYTELHGEAVALADTVNDIDQSVLACMKSGFQTFESGEVAKDFAHSYLFWKAPASDSETDSDELGAESRQTMNNSNNQKVGWIMMMRNQKKEAAAERALEPLIKHGGIDIQVHDDINVKNSYVLKVQFKTEDEAKKFSKFAGNATVTGKKVILGPDRAAKVFQALNISTYGKTLPKPMFDALLIEHMKLTNNLSGDEIQLFRNAYQKISEQKISGVDKLELKKILREYQYAVNKDRRSDKVYEDAMAAIVNYKADPKAIKILTDAINETNRTICNANFKNR